MEEHDFDVCVVSPGFGLSNEWICAVREAGVRLLSELELGWSRHKGKTVAVTGSNGKSTAVKWIYDSFLVAGQKAALGGNYGIPACEVVMSHPEVDWLVLEVSSFQLETVRDFSPEVGVVLNLLPNHLDRHSSMEIYRSTKARIFGASSAENRCLVPEELLDVFQIDLGEGNHWATFGRTSRADFYYENGQVFHDSMSVLNLSGTLFDSPILGSCTGAAVAAVARFCGIPYGAVEEAAQKFQPLPHRLRTLGEIDGVTYVNDSKATNLAAIAVALQACGDGILLIAGGLPKESDYTFVKEILAERVRSIYLIGQVSRAMFEAWSGVCSCVECGTLEKAFRIATEDARKGNTILLSPGCASFDQFGSFEERGKCFEKLFNGLKHA